MRSFQVLPGADPAKDCLPASPVAGAGTEAGYEIVCAEDLPAEVWLPRRDMLLRFLERVMLVVERPVNWLVGAPQLNPFYYTGQIAVFLLLFVSITGLFLVLFFQVGFDVSYQFVLRMEEQFLARTLRAAHRYASDSLIIVSLVHAFRLLVMDRFRGPRWLAWVSGVVMVVLLWLDGITGYWLIWDQRAQVITTVFADLLQQSLGAGASFLATLMEMERSHQGWIFMMILLVAHLVLPALAGLFFWLHIIRLHRPKWLLDRYWLIGLSTVFLIVSAAAPVGMLPQAELTRSPGPFSIDPIYLLFLPANSVGLWGGLVAVTVLASAVPWLSFRRAMPPRVMIDKKRCIGCTQCAVDCPYKAITMAPRTDSQPHKFIAIEHPDLCVSCGICVGSCDAGGVSLDNRLSTEGLWQTLLARVTRAKRAAPDGRVQVVLTCERHVAHGAHQFLRPSSAHSSAASLRIEVVPVPCVGAIHPDVVGRISEAGATEVKIVGCPPEDCANREGNLWVEGRLTRQRLPRLKRAYMNRPISIFWLPPDEFRRAIRTTASAQRAASGQMSPKLTRRNFVPAFALLTVVLAVQVWLTTIG